MRLLFGQAFQELLAELLRFAEKFLVLKKNPVQLQRMIGGELLAQHHVTNVDRIRQRRFLGQFFESGRGIVVVHTAIVSATASDRR